MKKIIPYNFRLKVASSFMAGLPMEADFSSLGTNDLPYVGLGPWSKERWRRFPMAMDMVPYQTELCLTPKRLNSAKSAEAWFL
jgi:hypothetical protein